MRVIRVLFLAERTELIDGVVPPHGSGAHVAADLWGLERHFEVLALLAEPAVRQRQAVGGRTFVRRLVPQRVRGLRQDLIAYRYGRRFARRAVAEAAAFHPDVVYERNEYLAL